MNTRKKISGEGRRHSKGKECTEIEDLESSSSSRFPAWGVRDALKFMPLFRLVPPYVQTHKEVRDACNTNSGMKDFRETGSDSSHMYLETDAAESPADKILSLLPYHHAVRYEQRIDTDHTHILKVMCNFEEEMLSL